MLQIALPNGHLELLTFLPSWGDADARCRRNRGTSCDFLHFLPLFRPHLAPASPTKAQHPVTGGAFALSRHGDIAIFTWGCKDSDYDGDSLAGRDQLKGFYQQMLRPLKGAVAAILAGRSVVTWLKQLSFPLPSHATDVADFYDVSTVMMWFYCLLLLVVLQALALKVISHLPNASEINTPN